MLAAPRLLVGRPLGPIGIALSAVEHLPLQGHLSSAAEARGRAAIRSLVLCPGTCIAFVAVETAVLDAASLMVLAAPSLFASRPSQRIVAGRHNAVWFRRNWGRLWSWTTNLHSLATESFLRRRPSVWNPHVTMELHRKWHNRRSALRSLCMRRQEALMEVRNWHHDPSSRHGSCRKTSAGLAANSHIVATPNSMRHRPRLDHARIGRW
mmetsp:Transcript_58824/g.140068  ORF Transcript_58824/g.140068 Transcript_58824/m.140068 type:complete len:209 (-) Transcript_58824:386-1012(-)